MWTAFFISMENTPDHNTQKHNYKFRKEERLCSQKLIEKLFAEGWSFLVYPFKVVALDIDFEGNFPAKVALAVSKKLYKKAVHRNAIKRRMREAYRLNKHELLLDGIPSKKAIMFIYVGKEILAYKQMERAMVKSLQLLRKRSFQNP